MTVNRETAVNPEKAANLESAVSTEIAINPEIQSTFEYYFSHSNIRTDKFLQEKMSENNGWIDSQIILSFNKMKRLGADSKILFDVIKKCPDLVEYKLVDVTETLPKDFVSKSASTEEYAVAMAADNPTQAPLKDSVSKSASTEEDAVATVADNAIKTHSPISDSVTTKPIEVSTKLRKVFEAYTSEDPTQWCQDFSDCKRLLVRKKLTEEFLNYVEDENINKKMVCIKGFDHKSSMDDIQNCLKPLIAYSTIRMIRNKEGSFFGKVVLELVDHNDLEKTLSLKIEVPKISQLTLPAESKDVNEERPAREEGNQLTEIPQVQPTEVKNDKINNEDKPTQEEGNQAPETLQVQSTESKECEIGHSTENPAKRIKLEALPNYLQITAQNPGTIKKQKPHQNRDPLDFYKEKFYRYTSNLTEVKQIKDILKEAAFVDTQANILRFKVDCDFIEKEYIQDANKITVVKLTPEEIKDYIQKNNLFTNDSKQGKKKSGFMNRKQVKKAYFKKGAQK